MEQSAVVLLESCCDVRVSLKCSIAIFPWTGKCGQSARQAYATREQAITQDFTGTRVTLVCSVFRYMLVNGYRVESSTTANNGGEHSCHTSTRPHLRATSGSADASDDLSAIGEAIYTCEMNQQKVTRYAAGTVPTYGMENVFACERVCSENAIQLSRD